MSQANRSIKNREIGELVFDPRNPRLPTSFGSKSGTESTIVSWLVDNANLTELLESIASQGFFDGEPILGYKDGDKYVVVEGNRRLAAVKLFNDPALSNSKRKKIAEIIAEAEVPAPESIPFIEYAERKEILDYLGYRHITGIKAWSALAKAKYLSQMRLKLLGDHPEFPDDPRLQFRRLAKEIGTTPNYVGRLLTGLSLYQTIEDHDFFELSEIDEETLNFSLLTTALSYINIAHYLGLTGSQDFQAQSLDIDKLRQLVFWIYKKNDAGITRLEDSRNLSMLSKVVVNGEALARFSSGDMKISEAILLTNHPHEILEESIENVVKNLKIALEYTSHVDNPDEQLLEKLKESSRHIKTIHTVLKSKQQADDLEEL